ncbi:MAG: PKD domain-containing protein, partial [Desulfobulbaceae bacterium]|nr:PKD domain-containing protein [Desulfobulbaceae bacterium]
DTLTFSNESPSNGTLTGTTPNLTYTPSTGYTGSDSFTFTVSDGKDTSASATITITVSENTPDNNVPVANNQIIGTAQDTAVAITLTGADADGDTLTFSNESPSNGTLTGTTPNLTYTPSTGYTGSDSFTFTVSDGKDTSTTATISITVGENTQGGDHAASGITVLNSAREYGQFSGTVTIAMASDETNITHYNLYWSDDGLIKSDLITSLEKTGSDIVYSIADDAAIPGGGNYIIALTENSGGEMANGVNDVNYQIPPISFDLTASRTSGVAPLGVVFTANFSNSDSNSKSFHDLEYSWSFGDPSADTWAVSGVSKNSDKGPVAAHVFNNSGNYTITLTIRNATGETTNQELSIQVNDPEVVFSDNTICFSNQQDFDGCPAGAETLVTDDINDIQTYLEEPHLKKRILLHRGSTWETAEAVVRGADIEGPIVIGAYGSCT